MTAISGSVESIFSVVAHGSGEDVYDSVDVKCSGLNSEHYFASIFLYLSHNQMNLPFGADNKIE